MKLSPTEMRVLEALDGKTRPDDFFVGFQPLQDTTELSRHEVRRACRSLKRKGLASFMAGLWTEDGEPAGSGYAITEAGRAAVAEA